jgi:hypothetical protein
VTFWRATSFQDFRGTQANAMEEAITNLRTVINTALNEDPPDVETSSDPSNISSLSGSCRKSLPRQKLEEERGRLIEIALGVERCLTELEGLLCQSDGLLQHHDLDGNATVVDLLVAVLISVPNALLQRLYKVEYSGEGVGRHIASMEDICFNSACISFHVIVKYILDGDVLISLRESHVEDLVEQITTLCEGEGMGMNIMYLIVQLLNTVSDQRQVERALFEKGYVGQDFEYHAPPSLFHMSAKETLRLFQMMLRVMEIEANSIQSSHVGLFASHLLEHFSDMAMSETGYSSIDDCQHLFNVWVGGTDEHMAKRLSDDDAVAVFNSITQFQIDTIQTSLQLIERADMMVASVSSRDLNDGNESNIQDCLGLIHDSMRHVSMSVSITEVMEKLSLEFDPEIDIIFHPLIVNFASFVATCLQDATVSQHLSLEHEGQGIHHLADDLLVRICCTTIGTDFIRQSRDGRSDEVLSIAVLRALSSGSISGKGKFLLNIAADRAQNAEACNSEPWPKRQCQRNIGNFSYLDRSSNATDTESNAQTQRDMTDLIMLCMTFTQSNLVEYLDHSSMDQASCIASSMMTTQNNKQEALDPLNPWHSLNINPLKELTSRLDSSHDESGTDSIAAYSSAVPVCFNTKAANP